MLATVGSLPDRRMPTVNAHKQLAARRFIQQFKAAFTTRSDGSSWPKFERTWRHSEQYFRGLLRPGRRKTITGLAIRMNADQECLERFVRESPWEHEQVEKHLRVTAPKAMQGPDAALIVDGMGIPKKGDHSVGVYQQWCGATGKLDNCQVSVNCTLARPGKHLNADQVTWPLGMRLYLPKKWIGATDSVYDDQHERANYARRREEAAIPDEIGFQPKYAIAVDQIEAAIEAGIDHACVIADTNYGMRSTFRKRLRELDEPYLLEIETGRLLVVPESTDIIPPGPTGQGPPRQYPTYSEAVTPETGADIADRVDEDGWTAVTWNQGTKGELSGSFYRERVRVVTDTTNRRVGDETGWLLLQRDHGPDNDELKVWLCWGLDDASLADLVSWAHLRWTIEQFHKQIKQLLGADEFQGRTWRGFHHHLAVVMLAQAFIAEQRLTTETDGGLPSFESVARQVVREAAIQRLMNEHGLNRKTAEEVGVDMLRGFSEWG